MFYSLLRQLVATTLKIYFRKIYLLHEERIPGDVPLVIAANHPMAFCDACLLACFLNRPLHFLVRGDVFVKRWEWFFKWTNQIPIYRFRDGFGNMRKNATTFHRVYQHLNQGAAVLIFAEGDTRLRKHLGALQKGPARIAFGAIEEADTQNLHMLPIGINYSDGKQFRSDVLISIGEAIDLSTYDIQTRDAKKDAVLHVTRHLYDRLIPHVIHCKDKKTEDVHRALVKDYEECRWPILDTDSSRFEYEKALAEELNGLGEEALEARLQEHSSKKKSRPGVLHILTICLLMPLTILGIVLNALPFFLAKGIANRRVGLVEFYSPVRIGLSMILEILWLLILLVPALYWFGPIALVGIFLIPMLGYLAAMVYEEIRY